MNENRLTLDTAEQVFFYEQDHYYLSSFSSFTVQRHGIKFPTAEHAYHWAKFPGNQSLQNIIRHAPSAHEAFVIAQNYKSQRRPDWDAVKVDVMRDILWCKYSQHDYIQTKLPKTGERILIENSWRDDFWGWGPQRDGQNMLGKLWMEVRAQITRSAGSEA